MVHSSSIQSLLAPTCVVWVERRFRLLLSQIQLYYATYWVCLHLLWLCTFYSKIWCWSYSKKIKNKNWASNLRWRTWALSATFLGWKCLLISMVILALFEISLPFLFPYFQFSKKNINFKIFLTFYITSTLFYYYFIFLKKTYYNTILFLFFFTFPYKLFQLYITSIIFYNYSKKITPPIWEEGEFQTGPLNKLFGW
jgi:hypothetical protein